MQEIKEVGNVISHAARFAPLWKRELVVGMVGGIWIKVWIAIRQG